MASSQNGYLVLSTGSKRLRKFKVPGADRHLILRDGSCGFLLVHNAVWFDRYLERLDLGIWDEWGHAVRPIRGKTSGYSNHASGTASDLNATRHPRGVAIRKTFTDRQIRAIRTRLKMYRGCLVWGGDWRSIPDGMHWEVSKGINEVEANARRLMRTNIGKEVLAANPGLRKVILS